MFTGLFRALSQQESFRLAPVHLPFRGQPLSLMGRRSLVVHHQSTVQRGGGHGKCSRSRQTGAREGLLPEVGSVALNNVPHNYTSALSPPHLTTGPLMKAVESIGRVTGRTRGLQGSNKNTGTCWSRTSRILTDPSRLRQPWSSMSTHWNGLYGLKPKPP